MEPGELDLYRRQLSQLLAHMDRLRRLATTGHTAEEEPEAARACPLREDRPEGSPLAEAILAGAPALEGDAFAVPRPPRVHDKPEPHVPE